MVERIFLSICVVYLSYVVSAFFAKPEWLYCAAPPAAAAVDALHPDGFARSCKSPLQRRLRDSCRISGNTIAPWQHFYLQAAVVETRVARQYPATRNDVLVAASVA